MAKTEKMTSSAKIVDGKLILSLPNAEEPVVWQMDLEQAKSSALTVKEDKKAKNFNLVVKTQDGKQEVIAPFAEKKDAMDVLMETSETLQNAHGKIRAGKTAAPASPEISAAGPSGKKGKGDRLGGILAALLALFLIFIWIVTSSAPGKFAGEGRIQEETSGYATNGDPRESSGVPVSADDFLSNH